MPVVEKEYNIETDKDLVGDYTQILMSDFHYSPNMCKQKLRDLKDYLEKEKGHIDFVTLPGDITYSQNYLRSKFYSYLKGELHELQMSAGTKLFLSIGNHDMQLFAGEKSKVRIRFKDLSDGDIIALDNLSYEYNKDINFIGITSNHESYSYQNFFGGASEILINEIQRLFPEGFDNNKYNIALMHDPTAVYNASEENQAIYFKDIDEFVSGHLHGGYLSSKILQTIKENDPDYGVGYTEFLKHYHIHYMKVPRCYGMYDLSNGKSKLVITEGISRYKGYIPASIYNDPYVTKINIKSKGR
jgi:predicted MPP superfamily phosphohydrolase